MTPKFLAALLFLTGNLLCNCSAQIDSHRIMTYNIRHGVGLDGVLDLERTARVIKAANPDIVILNEVDKGTERSFGVDQADSLGGLLEMSAVFGQSIHYDGGQYGNALLTRYPIIDFHILDLSTDTLLEGRSVFISRLDVGGDTLIVLGTHLGLNPEERQEQVQSIVKGLPDNTKLILAGDFNFEPDSDSYLELRKYLRDGLAEFKTEPQPTFPAERPERRIDYIFISEGVEIVKQVEFQHPETSIASDHLPQVLHFKWSPAN